MNPKNQCYCKTSVYVQCANSEGLLWYLNLFLEEMKICLMFSVEPGSVRSSFATKMQKNILCHCSSLFFLNRSVWISEGASN